MAGGYITELLVTEGGSFFPKTATGGSSATYFCDYWYTSIPSSGVSLRGCRVGGSSANGSFAGLGCAASNDTPSTANATNGSRLCYLPEHPLLIP